MPIARIHSPERSFVTDLAALSGHPQPGLFIVRALRERDGWLDLCPPGFEQDITPRCVHDPANLQYVPAYLKVDPRGESAQVTCRPQAGRSTSSVDFYQRGIFIVTPSDMTHNIPSERGDNALALAEAGSLSPMLAPEDIPVFVGGMVLKIGVPETNHVLDTFYPNWRHQLHQ